MFEHCPLCDRAADVREIQDRSRFYGVSCKACGRFRIGESLADRLRDESNPDHSRRYCISAATRHANVNGGKLELIGDAVERILATAPARVGVLDLLDRVLVAFTDRVDTYNSAAVIPSTDYALLGLRSHQDFYSILLALSDQGLARVNSGPLDEAFSVVPTLNGWKRAQEIRTQTPQTNQAFVAMWFDPSLREAYLTGIAPALRACGYLPYRVDFDEFNTKIDDRILAALRQSSIAVVDFTGHRRSVYFEAGFGWGLGIPVVATCREAEISDSSFDYRQYAHVLWNTPDELRARLTARLQATVPILQPLPEP